MPQYKVTYFDIRGLGEPIRIFLNYVGVPFEDDRISQEGIEKIRAELPYGQLPVLTVDGKKLAQSWTILRYLSKKHGAGGEGDWEQALVEGYGDFLHDLTLNCRPYFLVLLGRAQGDKAKMLEEIKPFMEKWTKNLDKILKESGSGFFAKSGPTYVDFFAANVYETAVKQKDNNVEHIAGLKTIHDNVKALPQLKEYFAKRADTPV